MSETTVSTIEHDIVELERLLEEKKATLEHDKSEKETLHEIVGEKIQEHAPNYAPSSPVTNAPVVPQSAEPPSYLSQDLKDKIHEIISIVFAKNLEEGIKEAARSGNMALIDAFHDILVDELYEQLLEKRKLERVE